MANAGLIEGNYTGTISQATGQCVNALGIGIVGCNVPATKISSTAMWVIHNGGVKSADTYVFDGSYGNALVLQNWSSVFGAGSDTGLKPEELWNIDTKIDGGNPASGKLVGSRWNSSCATGAANSADFANARYNLTTTTLHCAAIFRNLF